MWQSYSDSHSVRKIDNILKCHALLSAFLKRRKINYIQIQNTRKENKNRNSTSDKNLYVYISEKKCNIQME